MDSYQRRTGRQSRREGKLEYGVERRVEGSRPFRLAGAIFGERGPYRSGRSMGFGFLHEDSFGPDDDYGTVDPISSSSGPGDYISAEM